MTIAEVKDLSLSEKLQIMEAIWQDLRDHVDSCPISPATRDLLDSRRQRVASGEASIRDWDDVKHSIGRP
jgi:putative addiction module component (TIGR02574 family)